MAIRKPLGKGPAARAGTGIEQQVLDTLNVLHTQACDALPEDHPLAGVLSNALEQALARCPTLRVP